MDRDELRHQFVEEFGTIYEQSGGGRMLGRILGHLIVADPPLQSADDLATALGASKGSISQATRLLIQRGMIRRVRKPGERRDYFQARPDAWTESTRRATHDIEHLIRFLERGKVLVEDLPPPAQAPLIESLAFMRFWQQRVSDVFAEWERERESLVNELRNPNP